MELTHLNGNGDDSKRSTYAQMSSSEISSTNAIISELQFNSCDIKNLNCGCNGFVCQYDSWSLYLRLRKTYQPK